MKDIKDLKILVVGDIMLDKYVVGEVMRISPEAPVPIVYATHEYHTLGGCGNVVRNLVELGADVTCLSSIGDDHAGYKIKNSLDKLKVNNLTIINSYQTTVKERIIAGERNIQMIRIDKETVGQIEGDLPIRALEKRAQEDYDIIVVSDYAKGMITKELMDYLKKNGKSDIIVDPRPIHGYMYDGVFMITPNEKEWLVMQTSSQYMLKRVKYILETKGRDGMTLHGSRKRVDIPAEAVDVYNVSGAGDTVVAVMAICLSIGMSPLEAAKVANKCAGYAVTQTGTSIIPKNIFMKNL